MSAEINILQQRRPPVRLVFSNATATKSEGDAYIERQLAKANTQLIGAQADIAHAFEVVTIGRNLPDHDATMVGDTLESILRAALPIINISGASNRDRDLMRALRQWLQVNGSMNND
ncbi:hypothetical protein [Rhizobium sp. RM]|uniref:hypothetical protein n=1 Tax=Rhizobium sp. RM TaxID=2748079 RepID=UPI00110D62B0|nr:hypothetical protein [Rhizobium sp. RM]NWJ24744.1 hypothetical protein [Rhizobium sp. RM]TMV16545.1 hypothetical protein BJG94_19090 [Rhizobium sp. Td3]